MSRINKRMKTDKILTLKNQLVLAIDTTFKNEGVDPALGALILDAVCGDFSKSYYQSLVTDLVNREGQEEFERLQSDQG